MQICINSLDQVIWLAENWKLEWHLNLFSMTRVKCIGKKHIISQTVKTQASPYKHRWAHTKVSVVCFFVCVFLCCCFLLLFLFWFWWCWFPKTLQLMKVIHISKSKIIQLHFIFLLLLIFFTFVKYIFAGLEPLQNYFLRDFNLIHVLTMTQYILK